MNPEIETSIYAAYPKIFEEYRAGLAIGDGWIGLITSLCDNIQRVIDRDKCKQVVAHQIKEKFGGLRFYYSGGNDSIREMVDIAEGASFRICEECGKSGEPYYDGWVRVLCPDHAKEAGRKVREFND